MVVRMARGISIGAAILLLLVHFNACSIQQNPLETKVTQQDTEPGAYNSVNFIPGMVVVKYHNGISTARTGSPGRSDPFHGYDIVSRENLLPENISQAARKRIGTTADDLSETLSQVEIIEISNLSAQATLQLVSNLTFNSNVVYAEPLYIYTTADPAQSPVYTEIYSDLAAAGTDPDLGKQWGLSRIKANYAWTITRGSPNLTVGIIDSGIDTNHDDLKENLVQGYDYAEGDADPHDPQDTHSTHVSGIIGARSQNNVGVSGVAGFVKLMPIRYSKGTSGNSVAVTRCIYHAIVNNVKLINMSLGGSGKSKIVYDALKMARDYDVLVLVAAGNNLTDNDLIPSFPSGYDLDNIITVAASTLNSSKDAKAAFSQYGYSSVDIFAPGVSILSTYPNNQYVNQQGTSMACPFVTGVAALIRSHRPEWNYSQVKQAILKSADRIPGFINYASTGALVNAYKALKYPEVQGFQKIGEYFFENGSLFDTSGYGDSAIYLQQEPARITDRFGNSEDAYSWGNSGNYRSELYGGDTYALNDLKAGLSISLWVRPIAGGIISKCDSAFTKGWRIWYNNLTRRIHFEVASLNGPLTIESNPLEGTNLVHLVAIYNKVTGKIALVVNREISQLLVGNTGILNSPGCSLLIGASMKDQIMPFRGDLDDILMYNFEISSTLLNTLFFDRGFTKNKLIAEYSFTANLTSSISGNSTGVLNDPYNSGANFTADRYGTLNRAYLFNGNQYVDCGNDSYWANMSDEISISLWVKPVNYTQIRLIGKCNNTPTKGWDMWIKPNGAVEFDILTGSAYLTIISTATCPLNEYSHLVATYSKSTGKAEIFVNGKKTSMSGLFNGDVKNTVNPLMIGAFWGSGINKFNGVIDDVKIFNRVITPEEIDMLRIAKM